MSNYDQRVGKCPYCGKVLHEISDIKIVVGGVITSVTYFICRHCDTIIGIGTG